MSKYLIRVEEIVEREDDKYASNLTIYEQIVTGDESIVNAVVQTVLDYNSHHFMQSLEMKPLSTQRKDK